MSLDVLETFYLKDLYVLTPREAQVFILRYGLSGGNPQQVPELAVALHLSEIQVARSLRRGGKRLMGALIPRGDTETKRIVDEARRAVK